MANKPPLTMRNGLRQITFLDALLDETPKLHREWATVMRRDLVPSKEKRHATAR